jgi:hypothetical protein
MSNVPSKTTKLTTIRLKNEDIDALNKMAEILGENRSELIRILLMPSILQAKTAMQTKSVLKAAKVRMNSEIQQSKLIRDLAKKAEVQEELNLVEFGDFLPQPV